MQFTVSTSESLAVSQLQLAHQIHVQCEIQKEKRKKKNHNTFLNPHKF